MISHDFSRFLAISHDFSRFLTLYHTIPYPTTMQQVNLGEFLKHVEGLEHDIPVGKIGRKVQVRKSYTREFKLQTLNLLHTGRVKRDGKWIKISKREVARSVGVAPATLRDWEKTEDKISKSPKGSRRLYEAKRGGRAFWPEMERELVKEFTIARNKGVCINRGWFLRLVQLS